MSVSLTAGVRARCDECNRFLSRPSDTCEHCGREHVFAPADGYGFGTSEADRIAYDLDAGVVPPSSEDWDRELARIDRQQRQWEERQESEDYETVLSYDAGMAEAVPSSLEARRRVQRLEAELAEARGAFVEALVTDRESGWSAARLAEHLGMTRQAIGQQTPGVKRLPAGRPKRS